MRLDQRLQRFDLTAIDLIWTPDQNVPSFGQNLAKPLPQLLLTSFGNGPQARGYKNDNLQEHWAWKKCLHNIFKLDPGRVGQKSLATAVTNFTKPKIISGALYIK